MLLIYHKNAYDINPTFVLDLCMQKQFFADEIIQICSFLCTDGTNQDSRLDN